ncbi:MAG: hypothetical protein WC538_02305 [Thermoanaerobaculia bacterium]|jgi:hypothetical protein
MTESFATRGTAGAKALLCCFVLTLVGVCGRAAALGVSESLIASPSREISERHIAATDGMQGLRPVATDGEKTYVVWMLNRATFVSVFDRDGNLVTEKRIGEIGQFVTPPSIVHDGSRLLVAWSSDTEILLTPLTPQLELAVPGGIRVATASGYVTLETSRSGVLVAWTRFLKISAALLDHSFHVVASYADVAQQADWPSLASDGDGFVLVWSDDYPFGENFGVHTQLITPGSALKAPVMIVPGEERSYPAAVWNGQSYLITWGYHADLRGAMFSREGVAGSPFTIHRSQHGNVEASAPAWNGHEFMVAFDEDIGSSSGIPEAMDSYHLHAVRLNADGSRIGDAIAVSTIELASLGAATVWNGTNWFVSWSYVNEYIYYGVRASPISPSGEVRFGELPVPGIAVSRGPRKQSDVDLARGDGATLAVWSERLDDDGNAALTIGRIGTKGNPLNGEGVALATVSWPGGRIGCGSTRCLVAYGTADVSQPGWQYALDLIWTSRDGTPTSEPSVLAANVSLRSDVVSDGETFALIMDNYLALVRPDWYRAVKLPVGTYGGYSHTTPVASNGDGFLVAWSVGDEARGTYLLRVDADGIVTTSRKLLDDPGEYLALASDGDGYLLVFSAYGTSTEGLNLRSQRLDGLGNSIGGPIDLCSSDGNQSEPAVTWDGRSYVVAWLTTRGWIDGPLQFGRITSNGTLLDGLPNAPGVTLAENATSLAIDTDPAGQPIVAWTAPIEQPYESVERIRSAVLQSDPTRARPARRR